MLKILFSFFLVFAKEQKRVKNKFVTQFAGIIVKINFARKMYIALQVKCLLYSVFFNDYLKQKNLKKSKLQKALNKYPPSMCTFVVKFTMFWRLSGFSDLFSKYFWWNLNYTYLIWNYTSESIVSKTSHLFRDYKDYNTF